MLQVAVLEDEQESRVQIKRCLERYQAENHAEWDMDYFSSGAELLFSGASGYDMLLMDIEMPQMSGMEVARRFAAKTSMLRLYSSQTWRIMRCKGMR